METDVPWAVRVYGNVAKIIRTARTLGMEGNDVLVLGIDQLELLRLVRAQDRVDLATHQKGNASDVHPQHQDDHGGDIAVRGAVVSELGDVESKSNRVERNQSGGNQIAGQNKPEFKVYAGPKPVSHSESQ